MGRRHEARRRQQQLPLLAQFVDFALRPGVGAQGLDSGRHRGAGEDSSRSAGEGRRDGQAPAAGLSPLSFHLFARTTTGKGEGSAIGRRGMIADIHFMFEYSFVTSLISLLARASELPRRGAAWQAVAALLLMQARASSSARSSLIRAHSCSTSLSLMARFSCC